MKKAEGSKGPGINGLTVSRNKTTRCKCPRPGPMTCHGPWSCASHGAKAILPLVPSHSCPSSAASQLKMRSNGWTLRGNSGPPCSQGTPALALIWASLGLDLTDTLGNPTGCARCLLTAHSGSTGHLSCSKAHPAREDASTSPQMHPPHLSAHQGSWCHQWHAAKL